MASKPNTTPIYPGSVLTNAVRTSTANTNRDGTGSITDLVGPLEATDQGCVVGRVGILDGIASGGTSTAKVARLFRKISGTYYLIDEKAIPSSSPTTAVAVTPLTFNRTNIILAPGEGLGVSISVAEAVSFEAEYTPY